MIRITGSFKMYLSILNKKIGSLVPQAVEIYSERLLYVRVVSIPDPGSGIYS